MNDKITEKQKSYLLAHGYLQVDNMSKESAYRAIRRNENRIKKSAKIKEEQVNKLVSEIKEFHDGYYSSELDVDELREYTDKIIGLIYDFFEEN